MQVVLSFHACGSNVNDNVHIGLPDWVREVHPLDSPGPCGSPSRPVVAL